MTSKHAIHVGLGCVVAVLVGCAAGSNAADVTKTLGDAIADGSIDSGVDTDATPDDDSSRCRRGRIWSIGLGGIVCPRQ